MNRRAFLRRGALAAAATTVGATGYAFTIEPHWEHVVERELPIANLSPALAGKRLVQLSDIHVGPVDADYLVGAFRRAAALRPDIVVVTGDFLTADHTTDAGLEQAREILSHLPRGALATVGILGNHDYGRGWTDPRVAARVVGVVEPLGVRVLRNEVATVQGLDIVGIDDLWARRADPIRALDRRSGSASLVLCHNPDALDESAWGDYRGWVLAGHTHGGQCKPPFLPPPLLPVRNPRYSAGEVAVDGGRRLYINRGLGHFLRVRFNVRPEITSFTLRDASPA